MESAPEDKMEQDKAVGWLKLIYSEKATKFCQISTILLTVVKSKVEILQNFVVFSEYMNFTTHRNA